MKALDVEEPRSYLCEVEQCRRMRNVSSLTSCQYYFYNHTKYERPIMENRANSVDRSRREVLKRFAKWVPCKCSGSCGKNSNFVNDVGIGSTEGNDRKCRIVKLVNGNSARNWMAAKDVKALEDMRRDWHRGVL